MPGWGVAAAVHIDYLEGSIGLDVESVQDPYSVVALENLLVDYVLSRVGSDVEKFDDLALQSGLLAELPNHCVGRVLTMFDPAAWQRPGTGHGSDGSEPHQQNLLFAQHQAVRGNALDIVSGSTHAVDDGTAKGAPRGRAGQQLKPLAGPANRDSADSYESPLG